MGFGTTSESCKGKRVVQAKPVSRSPQAGKPAVRPRRGKVAPLWPAWQSHSALLHLTPSQARFADVFFHGDNCLLSGEAGSGKSYLVKALVDFLRKERINVAVCGSTGVAAFNIGGQTLHSFAGLGLADDPISQLISDVMKKGKVKERIRATDVLFLDEVSMIKGDLLDKVDAVFRAVRRRPEPFGACQVVFIGDWLQLAPVFKGDEVQTLAFQSPAWKDADVQTVVLKEQMRQQDDKVLLKVLNDIRIGKVDSLHLLDGRIGATFPSDGIEPVRIFCKNVDVDAFNRQRLAQLTTPARTYVARDSGSPYHIDAFNRNCPAPQTLELKVGAQVMLLTNIDTEVKGLVNGAIGVVKAFMLDGVKVQFRHATAIVDHNEWHLKEQEVGLDGKTMMNKIKATRRQIPLRLAWANTVHKCLSPQAIVHLKTGGKPLLRLRNERSCGVYGGVNRIIQHHHMPSNDALRITTRYGKQIICGPQHKLAIPIGISGFSYTEAITLKTGDKLVCKVGFPTNESSTLGAELCWWLGATVGDGSYNDNDDYRVDFANKPTECGDEWKSITERLFGARVTRYHADSSHQAWRYYFHSKAIRQRLIGLGLDYVKTTGKRVPEAVFSGSRLEIASFVCGLIDTDGHINKRQIVITSVGYGLLAGVQTLLAILGFKAAILREKLCWKLHLFSHQSRLFISAFGHLLRAQGKYRHLPSMLSQRQKVVKTQINDLPITVGEIASIRNEIAEIYGVRYGNTTRLRLPVLVPKTLQVHLGWAKGFFNHYTILDLARYLDGFGDLGPTCKAALRFVENGLYVDEVVSVELIENQDLMDITLDKEHQYWANGVLHHNCQGMTLDRAVVDIGEAFAAGQAYCALSRVRDMESLSIAGEIPRRAIKVDPACLRFYAELDAEVAPPETERW